MSNLTEVPTDELLSFQDYPTVHHANISGDNTSAQLNMDFDISNEKYNQTPLPQPAPSPPPDDETPAPGKAFWTIEYYQKFFDVDTTDVLDRILASVTPKRDNTLKHQLRSKPDLYGPVWISVTLIFTIAISGNVASYLQHANSHYRWKYDFHLVSYAATAIYFYVLVVPFALWGLLKWSSDGAGDSEALEAARPPGALELICVYGYSLFIYIPVSILWTIQISLLQWLLVLVAALVSGAVLVFTLLPALQLSRHRLLLIGGVVGCHLLLAAGFMLYFFHVPHVSPTVAPIIAPNATKSG